MNAHSNAIPGRGPITEQEELIEAGVPLDAIGRVEKLIGDRCIVFAGEHLRYLIRKVNTPRPTRAGAVLEIALLGDAGLSLEKMAKALGITKQTLCENVELVRVKLNSYP